MGKYVDVHGTGNVNKSLITQSWHKEVVVSRL
jgi:hypothetical protein